MIGVPDLLARHEPDAVRWFYATHHYRTKLPFGWDLMEQAIAGYQRIKRLVDVLAERLLAASEPPRSRPAALYASQLPRAAVPAVTPRLHSRSFGEISNRFIDRFVAAMDDDLRDAPVAHGASTFGYVNELYAAGAPEHPDLASLLAVYRCLTTHLAVFGVEIARPELHPELSAEYVLSPASGKAEGRGGDSALDRLLVMRTEARKARDFARGDAIPQAARGGPGVEVEDTPQGPRWTGEVTRALVHCRGASLTSAPRSYTTPASPSRQHDERRTSAGHPRREGEPLPEAPRRRLEPAAATLVGAPGELALHERLEGARTPKSPT